MDAFVAELREGWKPSTVSLTFRALQQFFRWLRDEEGMASPMEGMRLGAVRPAEVKPLTDDQLASCAGREVADRRGAELAWQRLADVGMTAQEVTVVGKGDGRGGHKVRTVPFGAETAQALGRYLRVRKADPWAGRTHRLWLAEKSRGPRRGLGLISDTWPADGVRAARRPVSHAVRTSHAAGVEAAARIRRSSGREAFDSGDGRPSDVASPMAKKPVLCRLGIHSYVYAHPRDEHQGPDQHRDQVCRRCEKGRDDHILALPRNPPPGLGPTIFG